MNVFDWDKAAEIIRDKQCKEAGAGLMEDWFWTGGTIFENGKPVLNGSAYLASYWATPVLEIDGEYYTCCRKQSETPGWDSDTNWPDSALAILKGE